MLGARDSGFGNRQSPFANQPFPKGQPGGPSPTPRTQKETVVPQNYRANALHTAILLGAILLGPALLGLAGQGQAGATPGENGVQGKQGSGAGGTTGDKTSRGAGSQGITPRESAADYAVHGELEGVGVGARLLGPDEVRKTFLTDLNSCCLVFEVALYPAKGKNGEGYPATGGTPEIARKDFAYHVVGSNLVVKPSSPNLLALSLMLVARDRTDLTPHGSVGVVLGSGGYDPTTGQARGRSIGTSGDVSVGSSQPGPHSSEADREFIEKELVEKSLPEGKLSAPVAGYLYFYLTKKNRKKTGLQLEFALGDQKVDLGVH